MVLVPTRVGVPRLTWLPEESRRMTSPPPMVAGSIAKPAEGRKVISRYERALMTSRPIVLPESEESAVAPTTVKRWTSVVSGGAGPMLSENASSFTVTTTPPTLNEPVSR